MTNVINTQLVTSTNVVANGIVPLGTVVHKSGCNLSATANAITVKGSGYYKVIAVVTVEPTAVATMTATMYDNGVQIAEASATPAVAGDSVNLTLEAIVYNACRCNNDTITIGLNSAGAVTNVDVIVERI